MQKRVVTEMDFRLPEFRDAKPEDYEFDGEGKVVRKDRWERAIGSIRFLVGIESRTYEIDEVVEAVRKLAEEQSGWVDLVSAVEPDDLPARLDAVTIKLEDGSVLRNARYSSAAQRWTWNGAVAPGKVVAWREQTA